MGLFKKKKNDIQEIELSEKHVGLRIALVVVFLLIGLACIAFFLISLLSEEDGWQIISPSGIEISTLESEFTLSYNLGSGEASATNEKKMLQSDYGSALERAYKIFDIYATYDDVVNLKYINSHFNETVSVSNLLYDAFATVEQSGSRIVYLGPIYAEYRNVFGSSDDVNAAISDPTKNEDVAEYVSKVLKFANDPNAVSVELLDNNKLKLNVSEEYLAFIEEYQIDCCIDFSWLANAFIVDHVADLLISKGYTHGNISSYDGYIRYLDKNENSYSIDVFDLNGSTVYSAALAECKNISAMVFWRKYPLNEIDASCYYSYSDGTFVNRYIDEKDGSYKAAIANILSYSKSKSCADIALALADVVIAEELDEAQIMQIKDDQIYSVWTYNCVVNYNDKELNISNIYDSNEITYTKKCVE
jgi:hypothetical protein